MLHACTRSMPSLLHCLTVFKIFNNNVSNLYAFTYTFYSFIAAPVILLRLSMFFMAAHSNGQAIIFCSCGFYLLSSFFLAYSQRSEIGCLPYFTHDVALVRI